MITWVQAVSPETTESPAVPGAQARLQGVVHKIRRMGGFAFVLLRTRRAVVQCVYDPERASFALEEMPEGAAVVVTGQVAAEPRSSLGWELLLMECVRASLPASEPPVAIHGKELSATLETLLDHRAVTLRHPQERAIFRLQASLCEGMRSYLIPNDFVEIHTPKLVAAGAEGGANQFQLDYFAKPAYLAQSPQLYKQMMVGVFERVFEIAPVFRAEKHDTARHLNEYTSVDLEMGFIHSFEDLMGLETAMLAHAFAHVNAVCAPELALLGIQMPKLGAVPAIRFAQAKALLLQRYGYDSGDEKDLDPQEERLLCRWAEESADSAFLFVTHYPSEKRPFYAMDTPEDPSVTESFDLLFRGLEVATGGQRIHGYTEQLDKMVRQGMDPDPFAGYLEAHRTGLPPHGGLGLGLERLTAQLLGFPNVRRATLFPRDTHRLTP